MNAVLHRKAEITIKPGNTFSNPQYLDKSDNSVLERFDYIVANPPFSMKNWRDGIAGKEYARFVLNDEIEKKNEYNLNITRYIDSTDPEDIQDIYAHIHGGIPAVDIDELSMYWEIFPSLKSELLSVISEKYYSLNVEHENIRQTIYKNTEFSEYGEKLDEAFIAWKVKEYPVLSALDGDVSLIISEPDGYAIARATDNIEEEITQGKNKGGRKVTGWEGRLLPKSIVIDAFFREEKNAIEEAENVVAETESLLSDLIEGAEEESALTDAAENGKIMGCLQHREEKTVV